MPDVNRQLLEEPFDSSLVRTRRGGHGRQLKYVETREYIRRLNAVFEGEWDFQVSSHEILQDEVVVLGKLTAGNVIKTAFGGSSITRSRENGEPIAISDDLKAAASDSLKKACSLLGIGLHLYSDDRPQQPLRPRNGGQVRTVRLGGSGGNGEGTNGPNRLSAKAGNGGNGGDRLSQKQLHAVWACAKDKAIPEQHVRSHSLEKYGKQVEFLAKAEASELISTIQSC